jgi:hypothetical protein
MSLPGWPEYWYGMPPMHYATHAVGPLLRLANARAESVVCFGSAGSATSTSSATARRSPSRARS